VSLLCIHLAVLLFGLSGLFGKTIELSPLEITWGRTAWAALSLGLVLGVQRKNFRLQRKDVGGFVLIGILLAFHWWTFFLAIQMSTVAIGLLSFATFPVFVILLEPITDNVAFRWRNLSFAALSFVGVALVLPDLSFNTDISIGGLWGVVSGALYAVVTVFNRRYVKRYSALTVGFWQYAIAGLGMTYFVFRQGLVLETETFVELLILGSVFTALAHGLFIYGLREVRAGLASLIGTLEPVYGVAAAATILGEIPDAMTLLGGGVIVSVIGFASQNEVSS